MFVRYRQATAAGNLYLHCCTTELIYMHYMELNSISRSIHELYNPLQPMTCEQGWMEGQTDKRMENCQVIAVTH